MLLHALTCPSNVVNAISVAAYKKYLMLSLIQQGVPVHPLLHETSVTTHAQNLLHVQHKLQVPDNDTAACHAVSSGHCTGYPALSASIRQR